MSIVREIHIEAVNKSVNQLIDVCLRQKEVVIDYMYQKIKAEDWHAVADAAMDIRDLEAEMKGYKNCLEMNVE